MNNIDWNTSSVLMAVILVIFLTLAVLFFSGRGGYFINGYNRLPKHLRSQVNEKGLFNTMGLCMLVLSFAIVLEFMYLETQQEWLNWVSLGLLVGTAMFIIFWVRNHYLGHVTNQMQRKRIK